jgi:hypothetical protein
LVFIRFGMNYLFTDKELSYLDEIIPGFGKKKEKIHITEDDLEMLEIKRKEAEDADDPKKE